MTYDTILHDAKCVNAAAPTDYAKIKYRIMFVFGLTLNQLSIQDVRSLFLFLIVLESRFLKKKKQLSNEAEEGLKLGGHTQTHTHTK